MTDHRDQSRCHAQDAETWMGDMPVSGNAQLHAHLAQTHAILAVADELAALRTELINRLPKDGGRRG